ncbi:NADP-dependent oxidoreductase [Microbacterium panaciterrae]|uniref:NADP-dependent oxidoreductase n=1 Tax=Microbacterium panaciterrae TaxID=985759 RepID=A0ABP8P161_9MICO
MRSAKYSGAGPASAVVAVIDVPIPVPGPGEVVVAVAAAGLNPVDVKIRAAAVDFGPIRYTDRPGWDVAGTISAVGPDVAGWSVGDRVFALAGFPAAAHTLADYAVVPVTDLALAPSAWTAAQAGAAPLAALTAWNALEVAGVVAGQRVLILGGAGGVGYLAVQLAKARGAQVIATASTAKHELVRSWGADQVIDYRDEASLAATAAVDAVIVTVNDTMPPRGAIAAGTAVVTITGFSDEQTASIARWGASPIRKILVAASGPQLAEIAALADAGKLTVQLDSEYALEDLAAAQERVETGRVTGKVVVVIDPQA